MHISKLFRIVACASFLFLLFFSHGLCVAQTETAAISGRVGDASGAVIVGAEVLLQSTERGTTTKSETNEDGIYDFPSVQPGVYHITVRKQGFRQVDFVGLTANVQAHIDQNFSLQIGAVSESITVTAAAQLNSAGGSVSTVIDSHFVENMPLNGRSYTALLTLAPGIVPDPDPHEFYVNGQRGFSNSFSIDGVSANIGGAFSPYQQGFYNAGTVMATTATGTTQATANMDELQEFTVQTAAYSARYGRGAGGQISFATRSGTNRFHGSLFEYFRNEVLDANDWFLNHHDPPLPRPKLRQNDFGGTLGGPLVKNKTFFFFALEFAPILQPAVSTADVPSQVYRNAADPRLEPLLRMFPLPNGALDPGGMSGIYSIDQSAPSYADALSLRLDQNLGHGVSFFARYHRAPSSSATPQLSYFDTEYSNTQTGTVGATATLTNKMVNQFRFNWSRSSTGRQLYFRSMGGSVLPPDSALFPPGFNQSDGEVLLSVQDTAAGVTSYGPFVGQNLKTIQTQWQLTDNFSFVRGKHQFDLGFDWRRISPNIVGPDFGEFFSILDGATAQAGISAYSAGSGVFKITSTSLYASDEWRLTPRLTLNMGLRWEVQPPPARVSGAPIVAAQTIDPNNPAAVTLALPGTPLWKTQYGNFAPRVGAAYHLFGGPGRDTVLLGAFGIFYDNDISTPTNYVNTSRSASADVIGTYPGVLALLPSQPFPYQSSPPYQVLWVSDPHLKMPYILNWNVGLQRALGQNQSLSLNYIGNRGERLILQEQQTYANSPLVTSSGTIVQTTNQAEAWYDALQVQFNRRFSHGLQALVNYTWSHSIDTASNSFVPGTPGEVFPINTNKASSDFDVRHMVTAAVAYSVPLSFSNRLLKMVAGGWSFDPLVRAYMAKPLDVTYYYQPQNTYYYQLYPDIVPGQPFWISDPAVGGGRRINPAAFSIPAVTDPSHLRQGDAGRNFLRGFPIWQADFALRRDFKLTERFHMQFSGEIFNIFNHPNFADPFGGLGYYTFGAFAPTNPSYFGVAQTMANYSPQHLTTAFTALPVLGLGGQRDVQLALKLIF